jgi:hypothetical protein
MDCETYERRKGKRRRRKRNLEKEEYKRPSHKLKR